MRVPDDTAVVLDLDDYVPSELIVARILRASRPRTARFRMPAHLLASRGGVGRLTPRRAAGLVIGAIGVSPAALAAAVSLNLALFGVFGLWLSHASALRFAMSAPRRPVAEHVILVATDARRPETVASEPSGRRPTRADSLRLAAERRVRDTVWAVVNQEIVADTTGGSLTAADSTSLIKAAAMLARFPDIGVRIAGERGLAQRVEQFFLTHGVEPRRLVTAIAIATGVPRVTIHVADRLGVVAQAR